MSDVKVTLQGDGSEAESAFHGVGEAVEEFNDKLAKSLTQAELTSKGIEKVTEFVKELGEKVVEFGKESVEAYFQIEKANMQLERAAGENTEAFKLQAEAMSEHLGVSNTTIETMQKLLVTYGEAPSEINKTIQSLLDYSAYSGKNAVDATRELTMSVTSGRAAFKELGLQFENTGEKSSTLVNLTQALADKIGGTADEESDTLEGRMKKATNQTNLLKQGIGELIATFITDTKVVSTFTGLINDLQVALRVETGHGRGTAEIGVELEAEAKKLKAHQALADETRTFRDLTVAETKALADETAQYEKLQAAMLKAGMAEMKRAVGGGTEGPSDKDFVDAPAKATKAEKAAHDDSIKGLISWDEAATKAEFERSEHQAKNLEKLEEDRTKAQTEDNARQLRDVAQKAKDEEEEDKRYEEERKKQAKNFTAELDELSREDAEMKKKTDKMEKTFKEAGVRIGEALINSITDALVAAMQGQAVDELGVVMDTAFAVGALAADALVSAYTDDPEVGALAASAVAGIGKIAHQARSSAWQDQQNRTHHDGGWIEPERPRYHLGTDEVNATLQTGEAVFSRADVARNGGRQGIEAMRRGGSGGGGTNVYVQAFDAKSLVEMFEGRAGRAVYTAAQTGRGDIAGLLGNR